MDAHQQFKRRKLNPPDNLAPVDDHQFSDQPTMQIDDLPTMPPTELKNTIGTCLDNLNDDCLLEIFSKNSLTLMDLCSLAETCKLFKRIAQRLFPKELAIDVHGTVNHFVESGCVRRIKSAEDVERVFKNFGCSLVALSVRGPRRYKGHNVMDLIAKHCVGTLKEFKIRKSNISAALAIKLKPIFEQLQMFSISVGYLKCSRKVFENCDSLLDLRIHDLYELNAIMENNFPNLQRFTFNCAAAVLWPFDFDVESNLLKFVKRNKALKYLNWSVKNHFIQMDVFLRKLSNVCKELEELEITFDWSLDVSHFQSLKRLTLRSHYSNFESLPSIMHLQKLKSLEVLKIIGTFDRNEHFDALPLLKNLRELDVNLYGIKENFEWTSMAHLTKLCLSRSRSRIDNVVDIITQLTNLKELEIYVRRPPPGFILSEKEFYKIVEVVKARPHVLTLKVGSFDFNLGIRNCNKYSKVKIIKLC